MIPFQSSVGPKWRIVLGLIIGLWVCSGVVQAEKGVYTWTDEKGVVHVTNQAPPPNAQEVKTIYKKPPADQDVAAPVKEETAATEDPKRQALEDRAEQYKKMAEDARASAKHAREMADEARKQAYAMPTPKTPQSLMQQRQRQRRQVHLIRTARQYETQAQQFDAQADIAELKLKQTQAELDKLQ